MVTNLKDAERRQEEVAILTQNQQSTNGNGKPNSKRGKKDPMWKWMADGLKVFNVQLEKSNNTKLRCIENQVLAKTNDIDKFWGKFMQKVEDICNSRKYTTECDSLGIHPINLAEHIVPMGATVINKVLKNGVYTVLGNDIEFYRDRLSPSEADPFRRKLAKLIGVKNSDEPATYKGRIEEFSEEEARNDDEDMH